MGSSMVCCQFIEPTGFNLTVAQLLAASRQTFAFSRDSGRRRSTFQLKDDNNVHRSALPFSKWLYRMNGYTKTPVNTVFFDAGLALALGLLAFAGTQAVNAVFAISVNGLYIAYSIPIAARFLGDNNFKPGPFNLGIFVSSVFSKTSDVTKLHVQSLPVGVVSVVFMTVLSTVFLFPSTPQTSVASMNYTVVVLGGVMIFSVVWYYFPKYGGVHWFRGPVRNVGKTDSESTVYEKM
jgi:Amino acid permease